MKETPQYCLQRWQDVINALPSERDLSPNSNNCTDVTMANVIDSARKKSLNKRKQTIASFSSVLNYFWKI